MRNYDDLIKNYSISEGSIWAYPLKDPMYELPQFGFKIHLSATILNAADIFKRVVAILEEGAASYKVISSLQNLAILNSGDYGYSQIGKFITIYPKDEQHLNELLERLYCATLGFRSVEIPSDFRYKNSEVVYYRYGELRLPETAKKSTDLRRRWLPKGVVVPVDDYYVPRYTRMPENYRPLICLRTRGKSRVFQGIDALRQRPVVIKEGRLLGEITSDGYDGVSGVMQEKSILTALSDISAFPSLIDFFYVGSSFVIIEEYRSGQTMKKLFEDKQYSTITAHKETILIQLLHLLEILHQRQICIGDLSLDNIILGEDGTVSLIDVEYYRSYQHSENHIPGTAGFWCRDYSGNQAVIYAFFSLWYYLTFPYEYNRFMQEEKNMYINRLQEYQKICSEAACIMAMEDHGSAISALHTYLKGT